MPGLLTFILAASTFAVVWLLRPRLGIRRALIFGVAATFVLASAVGLALLDLRRLAYGPLLASTLVTMAALLGGVVIARRRLPSIEETRPPGSIWPWLGLAAVVLGVLLRLSPSPYLHGGQDQGIYVNVGHHMARTGRLRPVDRLMAGAVRGVRQADVLAAHRIEPQPPGSPLEGVREGRWIAGLHVEDASEGRLMPGFFHLLPVWFAMCELDWGFDRSTWALVYFWLLSGLAALGLGQRLASLSWGADATPATSWGLGLLAALGLALHPLDLWISTFTVTENLARAGLLGSALLALEAVELEREGRPLARAFAVLAGLVFASAAFTRGSFVAHGIALAAALVLVPSAAPKSRRALLWAMVGGTTLAVVQAVLHSWPYFFSAASNHFHVPRIQPVQGEAVAWTFAAGGAVVVVDLALRPLIDRPRLARIMPWVVRVGVWLVLAGAVIAAIHHATAPDNSWGPSQQVASVLARYGGVVGLALGLVALALGAGVARDTCLAWIVLAAEILLATALKSGIRYEFYYARYLVADAIPVLIVGAAWLIGAAARAVDRRFGSRPARILALTLAAVWIVPPLHVLRRPVYWTRDLHDTPAQLRALFDPVPADAVMFFDARAPGRWRGILATPALLSFDKNVLVYPSNRFVEIALKSGTPVYFVSGGHEPEDTQRWPNPEHGPFHTQVVARGTYLAERAEIVEGGMPRELVDWGGPWELQRVDPSIWRGSGAFTLFPGSRFAHAQGSRLETELIEMTWTANARVELWLGSAEDPCTHEVHLLRQATRTRLRPLPADRPDVRYFEMPVPEHGVPTQIQVDASCPDGGPLRWHHLSMRWEP